jgi:hypothetical protein
MDSRPDLSSRDGTCRTWQTTPVSLVIGRLGFDAEGMFGACRLQEGRSGSIRAATGPPTDREASRRNAKDHHGAAAPPSLMCLRVFRELSRNRVLQQCSR